MKTAVSIIFIAAALAACSKPAPSAPLAAQAPPAKLSGTAVKEAELATITLTAEAENRLGLRTEAAKTGSGAAPHRFTGEVVEPASSRLVVHSSIAGTLQSESGAMPVTGMNLKKDQPIFAVSPLVPPSRDLRVTAEAEVAQARARLDAARLRKARADKMLADEVGTVRAQEDAQQEVASASIALDAADKRLRQIESAPLESELRVIIRAPQDGMITQVFATTGQTLSAGAQILEVTAFDDVWIRVPVYAGEVSKLLTNAAATVQTLSGSQSWTAEPIAAPPSADAASSSVHLYYRLPNPAMRFKPGEKLNVTIRGAGQRNWIEVPWSAVVFDTRGGSWVYESLGDRHYARRRVDLDHVTGKTAYLTAGISAATKVVVDGTAELWGYEFGTGK